MSRQHGVVARRQLLEMGLRARQIERRIASGRLHLVWRGVASAPRRRPGILVHRRTVLLPEELTVYEGIPVTDPVRTLIDEATRLHPMKLERAINEADKLDRVDSETLRAALERHPGEPGVAPLRAILDRRTFRLSDSDLELHFRPLARAARRGRCGGTRLTSPPAFCPCASHTRRSASSPVTSATR